MSLLSVDSQMQYGDEIGLRTWFNDHAQTHLNYAGVLETKYTAESPLFDLNDGAALNDWIALMKDPEKGKMTANMVNWLLEHQKIHLTELQAINHGSTVDLQTVDFRSVEQFYDWMNNHQQLHDAEDQIL